MKANNSNKQTYKLQRVVEESVTLDYEAIFKEIYKTNMEVMNDDTKSWYHKTQLISDKFMISLGHRLGRELSFTLDLRIRQNDKVFCQIINDFTNYVEVNFERYHNGFMRILGRSIHFI